MKAIGAKNAINLDGGRSSSIILNNKNFPNKYVSSYKTNGIKFNTPISDAIIFKAE